MKVSPPGMDTRRDGIQVTECDLLSMLSFIEGSRSSVAESLAILHRCFDEAQHAMFVLNQTYEFRCALLFDSWALHK